MLAFHSFRILCTVRETSWKLKVATIASALSKCLLAFIILFVANLNHVYRHYLDFLGTSFYSRCFFIVFRFIQILT